jgi:hypothetical protein
VRHVFVFPATSLGTLNAWERRTLVRLVYWEHWERHTSVWHVYWEHLGTPHFSVTWVVFYLENLKTSQLESWQPLKIKQGFAQRTRRTQRGAHRGVTKGTPRYILCLSRKRVSRLGTPHFSAACLLGTPTFKLACLKNKTRFRTENTENTENTEGRFTLGMPRAPS